MSSKEYVLSVYPNAEARRHEAVHEIGQRNEYQGEGWAIYTGSGLSVRALGEGPTEQAAWANAETKVLEERLRKPDGMIIGREVFIDAQTDGSSGGMAAREKIDELVDSGENVIVEEPDGRRSLVWRSSDGKLRTTEIG